MNKNKDLEMINNGLEWLEKIVNKPFSTFAEIKTSAERMAEEIERLKEQLISKDKSIDLLQTWLSKSEKMNEDFKLLSQERSVEIAYLKAELEKRPEVVKCPDCKVIFCSVKKALDEIGYIHDGIATGNEYCSRGQRRESEEEK